MTMKRAQQLLTVLAILTLTACGRHALKIDHDAANHLTAEHYQMARSYVNHVNRQLESARGAMSGDGEGSGRN